MDRIKKTTLAAAGAAACAGAGFLYMIAPGRATAAQRAPFRKRYFAHRGLHNDIVPENSLTAFRAAALHGYGVELDVRLTRDGVAVVSHDDSLLRMTGQNISIEATDFAGLANAHLAGTEETVPRLSDALDILCAVKPPVIVEVKSTGRDRMEALCAATLAELDARDGDFCVESFDPFIVGWFRRHAPELLRGQLTAQAENLGGSRFIAYAASRALYNFIGRPQFIAHKVGPTSFPVRLAHWLGAMRVSWVAEDRFQEARSDAVIFEHFLPPERYP